MQALLGLMMLAPTVAHAAAGDKVIDMLVLKMSDESTKLFALDSLPTITLADGKFQVTSGSVTTDYEQSDVTEYYFEKVDSTTADSVTAVTGPEASRFTLTYLDNSHVVVTGTKAHKALLYTQGGQLVAMQPTQGGRVTFNLSALQRGIYVLRLENEHSFKIIKK